MIDGNTRSKMKLNRNDAGKLWGVRQLFRPTCLDKLVGCSGWSDPRQTGATGAYREIGPQADRLGR